MKKFLVSVSEYINRIEPVSKAVLYSGNILLVFCLVFAGVVALFPDILNNPNDSEYICSQLFELGCGFFVCGIIFGLLSDVIIKYDIKNKR